MSRGQFGAIRRLPSGRYQARYRDPGAGGLVAAPLTFERKADAARWLGLYAHASDEADASSARRLETLFRDEAAGGQETGS